MPSSIPSPACHISVISYPFHRHLVSATPSSRIGYRMIPPRNQSQAIQDTGLLDAHLLAPSHRPTASRPASSRTVSPDGSNRGPTPSYSLPVPPAYPSRPISSAHLPARCLPASSVARCHPTHAAHSSHRLIHPACCFPVSPHAAHPSHRHISSAMPGCPPHATPDGTPHRPRHRMR